MILTVTLNPLLERRYAFPKINFNYENRNGKKEIKVGGKGINVSRQLNSLGIENIAFTFHGGVNGKIMKEILVKEKIKNTSVHTAGETRECAIAMDETLRNITTFFGPSTNVSEPEADEFKLKLEKMIENCEIVVFAGSSPSKATDSIFPFGIDVANKYDKISVCDTYGDHLRACIEKSPTIIHNNITEVEKSLSIRLDTEESITKYLNELYKSGIKQTFLTNGAGKSYAANFDFLYKVENPKIEAVDPTGSGDCFVAGIVYGWHNNLTFEETLLIASKMGVINASRFDICNVGLDDLELFPYNIKISATGKKMKTLDVSPR